MSGAIAAAVSGGGFDSTPNVDFIESVQLGERPANSVFSHTLDIGEPAANRRVIAFNMSDYFSRNPNNPVLSQKCRFAGQLATRIVPPGNVPEGFVVDTEFAVYIRRLSVWVSQPLPSGSTVNIELECTARTNWSRVGFLRVTNLLNTSPSISGNIFSPQTEFSFTELPAGTISLIQGFASTTAANDPPTTVTNADFLFNAVGDRSSHNAFLAQNTTRQAQTATFTANSGGIYVLRWR